VRLHFGERGNQAPAQNSLQPGDQARTLEAGNGAEHEPLPAKTADQLVQLV
jgi:hypothetical protein